MLALHARLAAATVPADRQIDALVYELRPKGVPVANAEWDMA